MVHKIDPPFELLPATETQRQVLLTEVEIVHGGIVSPLLHWKAIVDGKEEKILTSTLFGIANQYYGKNIEFSDELQYRFFKAACIAGLLGELIELRSKKMNELIDKHNESISEQKEKIAKCEKDIQYYMEQKSDAAKWYNRDMCLFQNFKKRMDDENNS